MELELVGRSEPGARRRTVWVVDDSPGDAEAARRALAVRYHVEVFRDGSEVLEQLATRGPPPDVLVLDWVMPGITGVDVCRYLRSPEGNHPELPVILLTVRRDTAGVVEGLAAGADDFVAKPAAPEELLARVDALVRAVELRERAERAEADLSRLLAEAPDALLAADGEGRVVYANRQAEQALGLPSSEILGRLAVDLVPDLNVANVSVGDGESLLPLPDVRVGNRLFAPTVRYLPSDHPARTTIALRDVTARRAADARRLDFYSMIAHDLRTPLSSVLLRVEHILGGGRGLLSAELRGDLHKIESALRSMVEMISEFLELARLEGIGRRLSFEPCDLTALTRDVFEELRPLAEASRLRLSVDADDPVEVRGDRRRLVQVVTNLLSNAIKYTGPGGRITGRVRVTDAFAEVDVADTGEGIDPALLPAIFDRYTRATDQQKPGSGLGLMIVREIVEAHGGTVGATSRPGAGSTFWFRLPRWRP